MEKRQPLLLLLLFACTFLAAQSPPFCPSNNIPAADLCSQTCIYCNLSEYNGNTDGYTGQFAPGFCGTIENEEWLGFIAGASFATISVVPSNCQIGNGMQVALYSSCNSTPIGCNGGGVGGGFFPVSITVPLTPGTAYYLMIDSYAGDICDFTVTVSPPGAAVIGIIDTQKVELCPNETFTFHGVEYEAPKILKDTLPNPTGACDSIIVYNLVPVPYQMTSETITFCPGHSVVINGVEYTESTVVEDTIPSTNGGCDTIATYTLVLLPYVSVNKIVQFCPGDSVVIGGVVYTQPGFVTDTIPSTGAGCDTIAKYALLLLPQPTTSQSLSFCPGSSVTLGGQTYTQSGTVTVHIPSSTGGCDTLATYELTFLPYPTSAETIEFCAGKSVTIGGMEYSQSGTVIDTVSAANGGCDTIVTYTLVQLPYNTGAETVEFCAGRSVTIGGVEYTQSGIVNDTIPSVNGGCDTVIAYILVQLPYNTGSETVEFCPGKSVTIGGISYTQSGTVIDTIPSTNGGCDTIVTYTLVQLPYNTRSETIEFCLGDQINIGGNIYTQAGTVIDTVAGIVGCDTIVTYTLVRITSPGSSVSIKCISDISIGTQPGTGPYPVTYDLPTATSDCACPGIGLTLISGLASGSLFPVTTTQVCYEASDSCGNTSSCCFKVTVREEEPCDVKVIGCMKYELLSISKGTSSDLTYEIRVTNNCSNKMIYTAMQLPNGIVAVKPINNSVFTAPSGRAYDVRNPNYTPFYSVRFKSQADSIANGQADIFKFTLPGNTKPDYIHITARLYPQIFYEAHLNTFYCPITPETGSKDRDLTLVQGSTDLLVYPNPTTGVLFADLSSWDGQELKIRISNSQGQQIRYLSLIAQPEAQEIQLPEGLAGGLYFLEVSTGAGEKKATRFVVQR